MKRSFRSSRILLLALLVGITQSAHAALRPDDIQLEGRLFDIKLSRFNQTEDVVLLEQFFRKNIVNHRDQTGAFVETVEHNRTRVLKAFPESRRISLIRKWLDGLEKDHPDLAPRLDAARLYLGWAHLADQKDAPSEAAAQELRQETSKALAGLEVSPWSHLAAGLVVDFLGTGAPELELLPTLEHWERAGEAAAQEDAHLHFLLGDLLSAVVDPTLVPVYCKKVATEFEKALLISPSDKQLYAAVAGRYHEIFERISGADQTLPFWFEELVFKRLIAVEPTNARAHNNLSFLYSQYGVNLKEALKEAQIANQLEPGDPNLIDTLGWAYYKMGNSPKSIELFRRALELDDSLADVHFHLATVLYDDGQLDEAVEHFRATVSLDPTNAFALNNLAYLFSERGSNLKEGLELVGQALKLQPQNSAFLDTKGWIYFRLGRHEEANAFVEKAIALQPEVSELHMHAGQVALARGRYRAATDHFEKALTYDPKNTKLARELARIFALDGLRQGLARFSRIHAVTRKKDNFEVFYRAMAEIYQVDKMYVEAVGVLGRFTMLPDGAPPVAASSPSDDEPGTHEGVSAPDGEEFAGALRSLPEETDMAVSLEHKGLVGLLDVVIKTVKTPLPLAAFRDQIANHLPRRIVIGFDALQDDKADGPSNVALLQFDPATTSRYAAKLAELGETSLQVPGLRARVQLKVWTYKDHQLGTIGIPGSDAHYAVLGDSLAFSRRKSALVRLLDQASDKAPGFSSDSGFGDFVARLSPDSHAIMVGDIPALLKSGARTRLGDSEKEFMAKLAVVCSQYVIKPESDTLAETSMLYPRKGQDLTGTASQAEKFAQESIRRFPGSEDLQVESSFGEVEGRVQGNVTIRGIRMWIGKLIQRMSSLDVDLPDLPLGGDDEEDLPEVEDDDLPLPAPDED